RTETPHADHFRTRVRLPPPPPPLLLGRGCFVISVSVGLETKTVVTARGNRDEVGVGRRDVALPEVVPSPRDDRAVSPQIVPSRSSILEAVRPVRDMRGSTNRKGCLRSRSSRSRPH